MVRQPDVSVTMKFVVQLGAVLTVCGNWLTLSLSLPISRIERMEVEHNLPLPTMSETSDLLLEGHIRKVNSAVSAMLVQLYHEYLLENVVIQRRLHDMILSEHTHTRACTHAHHTHTHTHSWRWSYLLELLVVTGILFTARSNMVLVWGPSIAKWWISRMKTLPSCWLFEMNRKRYSTRA